jgi:hypothetical protein
VLDLPATGQLLDDQLGVEARFDGRVRIDLASSGEPGDQAAILGNVVGLRADVLSALGEHLTRLSVPDDRAVGGRTRVAPGAAISLDDEAGHALETGL